MNGCWEIYYEKLQYWLHVEKEMMRLNIEKNKRDKASYLARNTTCRCCSLYQIWTFYLIQLRRYLWRKCGKKEKWINIKKNKQENAGPQSHDTTYRCLPVYQIWTFYLKWFWRYLWRKRVTNGRKDGRCKSVYLPLFQSGGIIMWWIR